MFGKLKEKLKASLSIFSRKAEEEAKVEEKVVEQIVKTEIPTQKEKPQRIEPKEPETQQPTPSKSKALPKKKQIVVEKESKKPELKKEPRVIEVPQLQKEQKEKTFLPEKIPAEQVRITYFVHGTTTDNEAGKATGWEQGKSRLS